MMRKLASEMNQYDMKTAPSKKEILRAALTVHRFASLTSV